MLKVHKTLLVPIVGSKEKINIFFATSILKFRNSKSFLFLGFPDLPPMKIAN